MKSCYRSQRRFCSKKGEDISVVKNREERGLEVCKRSVKKRAYSTIKVTIDVTGILCAKERWEEDNSTRL